MREHSWNHRSVFADRQAWQTELQAVGADLPGLAASAGTLATSGAHLAEVLDSSHRLANRAAIVYFYALMSQAVDSGDTEAQSMVGQAGSLWSQLLAGLSFLDPEILGLDPALLDRWRAEVPALGPYAHFFDNLRRKQAHVRSAEVEEVLGLAGDLFQGLQSIHDQLVDTDLAFAPAAGGRPLAQATVEKLLGDPDREVRRTAWEHYCDAHLALKNTLAASLTTQVRADVFKARARRFDTALDAALFEPNLPRAVFDSTLETFRRHLPVWHRYWKVRRRALGVERLHHYDIWAPLTSRPPIVTFPQAVDWIGEGLAPLGRPYVETLRRGCLEEGWIDLLPTPGKGSGAFSGGAPGIHPFIMMSWADDLSSLSTLTHELGHSMHSWHTWKHQPLVNTEYSIFVAEVASNFHQALTRAHLFDTQKDPDFQIALIEEAMENFHRYFFIMPTLARFELEHHSRVEAGRGVTADDLNGLMADLFAEGYGGELEVDRDREGSTWAQFGHLYMNFYVFQYATGISAAHALADPIRRGDSAAAARYLDFLSAGGSDDPVKVLGRAGVDMTTPAAMEKGFEVLSGLVDRLEVLTDRRR